MAVTAAGYLPRRLWRRQWRPDIGMCHRCEWHFPFKGSPDQLPFQFPSGRVRKCGNVSIMADAARSNLHRYLWCQIRIVSLNTAYGSLYYIRRDWIFNSKTRLTYVPVIQFEHKSWLWCASSFDCCVASRFGAESEYLSVFIVEYHWK